jgi:hypothetical protein
MNMASARAEALLRRYLPVPALPQKSLSLGSPRIRTREYMREQRKPDSRSRRAHAGNLRAKRRSVDGDARGSRRRNRRARRTLRSPGDRFDDPLGLKRCRATFEFAGAMLARAFGLLFYRATVREACPLWQDDFRQTDSGLALGHRYERSYARRGALLGDCYCQKLQLPDERILLESRENRNSQLAVRCATNGNRPLNSTDTITRFD